MEQKHHLKIFSHNTFSYLPLRKKWMKPFSFIAKCQSLPLDKQLDIVSGVDVRVRFDKQGNPIFVHGLIEYEGDVYTNLKIIDARENLYARVILETTSFMSKNEREFQKECFYKFCEFIANNFLGIHFYAGWPRDRWRIKVYSFDTIEPKVTEMHGSVSGNKLNCLRLKSWARKHNKSIIENAKTDYVMIDYIEYK